MIIPSKIWFITGVSGGLGRALAREAAESGDIVFGTLRKPEQVEEFNQLVSGKTFGLELDVNDHSRADQLITHVRDQFGRIDILVNNAGYGLFGAIEEVSIEEARQQMETNFFSVLALTQLVLPIMRNQESGSIIQISSMAGIRSNPGLGMYNASKFALEGFSEALALETAEMNIRVMIVEPGPFRTDWAGSSAVRSQKIINEYDSTAGERIRMINNYSGTQPGNPVKGAKAIIKAIKSDNPPLRLVLGKPALDGIREKLKSIEQNLSEWEATTLNTSFD
ncbi:oxidoreductase [Daejeonella oryzae]|uniref:oxidoreductase n=1 Tax=Daejeonella oryzae TaxID=1122943 RepID=UPI0004163E92|nr:oxidoreductase [Daejeonella oryzae]